MSDKFGNLGEEDQEVIVIGEGGPQKNKRDVLAEVVQLIDWVNQHDDKEEDTEKVKLKEKFRNGYLLLEELQTKWEKKEEEVQGIVEENRDLKKKLEEGGGSSISSLEELWKKVNSLQGYFWGLVGKVEGNLEVLPEPLKKSGGLEGFKREMNELFFQVQLKLRKLEGVEKDVEGELEGTKKILEKLNEMVSLKKPEEEEVTSKPVVPPPGAAVRKKLPPPALLPLGEVVSSSPVKQPPPPPLQQKKVKPMDLRKPSMEEIPPLSNMRSVITHTQHVQSSPKKNPATVAIWPPISLEPKTPPVPVVPVPVVVVEPVTVEPVIIPPRKNGGNCTTVTSIPPTHIHRVIHPALPQSQDIPIQEAVVIEGADGAGGQGPAGEQPEVQQPKPKSCMQSNVCGLCRMTFNTLVQLKLHHAVVHSNKTPSSAGASMPPPLPPPITQRPLRLPHPALRPSHQIASILQLERLQSNQSTATTNSFHRAVASSHVSQPGQSPGHKRVCMGLGGLNLPLNSSSSTSSSSSSSGYSSSPASSPSSNNSLPPSPGEPQSHFGRLKPPSTPEEQPGPGPSRNAFGSNYPKKFNYPHERKY